MTESKKEWVTPELIVLVRSKPEEAVLVGCKFAGNPAGSGAYDSACRWCSPCDALTVT